MKISHTLLLVTLLFSFSTTMAQATYPPFSKVYWEDQQEVAQGKIIRGAALGATGLLLLWPTAVMINKSQDNPQKYVPLSILFGAASLGAMGHGFSSIGSGVKEKETATYWADQYAINPDSTDLAKQQEEYLDQQQLSATKSTLFGVYATTIGVGLLTNGVIQSSRDDAAVTADDITIWPYYAAGGVLLPLGIFSMVKALQKSHDVDSLATTSPTTALNFPLPVFGIDGQGRVVFGAVYNRSF